MSLMKKAGVTPDLIGKLLSELSFLWSNIVYLYDSYVLSGNMHAIVFPCAAFGAALDAHRRAGNSLKAVAVLGEMRAQGLEPTASHYNLVIRTLKAEVHIPIFDMGYLCYLWLGFGC